ncbi:hypothetical protein JAAARDRAFT_207045 [Jaapia argillacea MUCL 33604]|uniref:DEK-C domain-containing protein n=1 Tax=Jaapia argillacea MUCL 33604 TaxID=933084 RepID=A0A067PUH8_9AGAM|nr:hypothetical protein JAAARDRAFT_207045 [Jaapia argillacea MUCL 33604]
MSRPLLNLPSARKHKLTRKSPVDTFIKWASSEEACMDGVDQISLSEMRWGKKPGRPSHEYLVLTFGTFALRLERDTDSWRTLLSPDYSSACKDTISISDHPHDLIEPDAEVVATLVTSSFDSCLSHLVLLLDIIFKTANLYNVYTFNCWWFTARLWINLAKTIPANTSRFRALEGATGHGIERMDAIQFAQRQQYVHLAAFQRLYGTQAAEAKGQLEAASEKIDATFNLHLERRTSLELERPMAKSNAEFEQELEGQRQQICALEDQLRAMARARVELEKRVDVMRATYEKESNARRVLADRLLDSERRCVELESQLELRKLAAIQERNDRASEVRLQAFLDIEQDARRVVEERLRVSESLRWQLEIKFGPSNLETKLRPLSPGCSPNPPTRSQIGEVVDTEQGSRRPAIQTSDTLPPCDGSPAVGDVEEGFDNVNRNEDLSSSQETGATQEGPPHNGVTPADDYPDSLERNLLSPLTLKREILAIVRDSDWQTLTKKVVRNRLEEQFGVDLASQKLFISDAVNDIIREM